MRVWLWFLAACWVAVPLLAQTNAERMANDQPLP